MQAVWGIQGESNTNNGLQAFTPLKVLKEVIY